MPAPGGLPRARYEFADLRLDADGALWRAATALPLPADELAQLRERLQPTDCIQNVYKRGYRISVAVRSESVRGMDALPRVAIVPVAAGYGVEEYLGPALLDYLLRSLSGESGAFAVTMARDSVETLTKRGLVAREIGKALEADLVLVCRLEATLDRSRLHAEMMRVGDGAQLWTEDMLAPRNQIAELGRMLVNCLARRMQGERLALAAGAAEAERATDLAPNEAGELALRAHQAWQSFERHRMQDAMRQLEHAIEIDPAFKAARVDLAYLSVAQALFGFMPATAAARMVHRAAEQLPESAEGVTELLPALGWMSFHVDRDLRAAVLAFARSAHLKHEGWITRVRSMVALSRGRFDEAIDLLRAAIELDPYAPALHAQLGWALHLAGEADASAAISRHALAEFPDDDSVQMYSAMIMAYNGDAVRACETAAALAARRPHFDFAMAVHAYALARAGREEQARELLERLQWLGRERFVMNGFQAAAYVAFGEHDAALEDLRMANENRSPWFFQMLADPRVRRLRGQAEFEAMRGVLAAG